MHVYMYVCSIRAFIDTYVKYDTIAREPVAMVGISSYLCGFIINQILAEAVLPHTYSVLKLEN